MDLTREIKQFIIEEFLPDAHADQLDADYDLLANGVIDSLGLLVVVSWLEDRFQIAIDDVELAPDSFRTVDAISSFIESAKSQVGTR
jgi:acyl carrier protein